MGEIINLNSKFEKEVSEAIGLIDKAVDLLEPHTEKDYEVNLLHSSLLFILYSMLHKDELEIEDGEIDD